MSIELARAVKSCRVNEMCIYPRCKAVIGQCWTGEQIRTELATNSTVLVASEMRYVLIQRGLELEEWDGFIPEIIDRSFLSHGSQESKR